MTLDFYYSKSILQNEEKFKNGCEADISGYLFAKNHGGIPVGTGEILHVFS